MYVGYDCPTCGAIAQAYTSLTDGSAHDGDEARCKKCHWPGKIVATPQTFYVVWHNETDCKCVHCKRLKAKEDAKP